MAPVSNEARKRCTACGERLPLSAFNRATRTPDGRAPTCRRCTTKSRQVRSGPQKKGEIRAAIKAGEFELMRELLPHTLLSIDGLLAIATQDYNTAKKHAGHEKIIKLLISRGAKPRSDMIFEAVRTGSQSIVDLLIDGGAEQDIFVAAAIGDAARITKLLKGNAQLAEARTSPDIRHYQDFAPLHFCSLSALGRHLPAKEQELFRVAELLVEAGAGVDSQGTFYGSRKGSASNPAVSGSRFDSPRTFVTPLDMAAHTGGNLSLIRFLIEKGAEISSFAFANALAHRGRPIDQGFALAELFLQSGFKIDSDYKDGATLHTAANAGMPESVQWLLEHGANVNGRGRLGRTPLHLAAERNMSPRVAEMLIEWGADLRAKDDLGLTALDVANEHGKRRVAEYLRGRQR